MKLSCDKQQLKNGLASALGAIEKRSPTPIARNVKMVADQASLTLTGSSTQMTVETTIPARVEETGETTAPAHFLSDFVASLAAESVLMDTGEKEGHLVVSYNHSSATIATESADDFPISPKVDATTFVMDPAELMSAIDKVAFSAARDNTRIVLTAAKIDIEAATVKFITADGFRMSLYTAARTPDENEEPGGHVLVPISTLKEVRRNLRAGEESVTISLDEERKHIAFATATTRIISSLVGNEPPNYEALVPERHDTVVTMPVSEMLMAARTLMSARDKDITTVRIAIDPDANGDKPANVVMHMINPEVGDNKADLTADVEGRARRIAFNNDFVVELLGSMHKDSSLSVKLTSPGAAALFTEIPREGHSCYMHVMMPVSVPNWTSQKDEAAAG